MSDQEFDEGGAQDIAIVGMSAHLPGATNVRKYWKNLREGVCSVQHFSDEALIAAGVSPETLKDPNYVKAGVTLDHMAEFDGEFFGFSPKESAILDPQHRHFLETCWEAFEDAGHMPDKFDGAIGVFAGCGMGAYFSFNLLTNQDLLDNVGLFLLRHTGNDKDFLSTRVSYCLNLKGPSINIQTACSTSLVAVHQACQSLLSNECDLALAGGVTIEIPHGHGYHFKEGEILSPTGLCYAFDHRAQGTIFGSGSGVVVLRRLEDALNDGDHIYACVRGSAINNDGSSKVGYLAPSVEGQAEAITECLAIAELDADEIDYVECHGTGTEMGDPIEVSALTEAFRQTTDKNQFCGLGSVKTNIGHLDTAAGVASMIKAVMGIYHAEMPPSLNYEKPNPAIPFETSPFFVNDKLRKWPDRGRERRAAVNSLGVGGTNAHVILEQAPDRKPSGPARQHHQMMLMSARSKASLDDFGQKLADFFEEEPDTNLADAAYTLFHGRRWFEQRRVVVADSPAEAAEILKANDPRRVFTHTAVANPSLVFLYPGGGAQYPRMALELYEKEPEFRRHIDRGLDWLKGKLDVDLRDLMTASADRDQEVDDIYQRPAVQLPAIFLVEYALTMYWMARGVKPDALMGHSLGENTAACVAGVFSFEDALGLVTLRGQLFETVPRGGMLSVEMSPDELKPYLGDELDLAVVNAPKFCVASGTSAALDGLRERLAADGHEARRIPIDIAAHSRLLEDILTPFGDYLRSIKLNKPNMPLISNRTGTWMTDEQATSPDYWVEHLRGTVFFADGVTTLTEKYPEPVFMEVGPGKALSSLVRQHPNVKPTVNVISCLRHAKEETSDTSHSLGVLGRLWASGVDVDIDGQWKGERRLRIPLPTYAFRRQHYFIEPSKLQAVEERSALRLGKLDDIDDWFYQTVWKKRLPLPNEDDRSRRFLIFHDESGVGRRIAQNLKDLGHEIFHVNAGDDFYRKDDHHFILNPEHGEVGYGMLMNQLSRSGDLPDRIIHCWMVTEDESFRLGSSFFDRNMERGFYSLFFLAKSLSSEDLQEPLHVQVLSNNMQQVFDETSRHPEKSMLLGPVRVMSREMPELSCSSVDLDLEHSKRLLGWGVNPARRARVNEVADQIMGDVLAPDVNVTVAYRKGERYEERQVPETPQPMQSLKTRIKDGGVYLITGGLGGLGLTLGDYLAREYSAKLVLIGRTALPDRDDWQNWLENNPPEGGNRISRRVAAVLALEEAGAEVEVAVADVSDSESLGRAIEQAKARFGQINGVFHTAGAIRDDIIPMKTYSSVAQVFTPKVYGTKVLDQLFEDGELDFHVLFSSTSSLIAPTGQIDYVAANAFLNAYAESKKGCKTYTVAINWGVWNEVGMAAEALGQSGAGEPQPIAARHPIFDTRLTDHHGRSDLKGLYAPRSMWLLDEHRTKLGQALIPGTGYLEMARAALREHGEQRPFVIEDLYFFRALYIPDDGEMEVRVVIEPDSERFIFRVQSKITTVEGRKAWVTHAGANLYAVVANDTEPIDLAAIEARCDRHREEDPHGVATGQEEHMAFGPRWRVLKKALYGDGEAIAELELPRQFEADLEHFGLHPALMDLATGYAMPLIEGYEAQTLWVPVNYKKVRVRRNLTRQVRSWIRNAGANKADSQTATFNIVITDLEGNILLEVESFTIRRLDQMVDFSKVAPPAKSELEFEYASEDVEGERTLSPAERVLRHNLTQGILPDEGMLALERVLGGLPEPRIVVSSLDLNSLIKQAGQLDHTEEESGGNKFSRPELDSDYEAPRDEIERRLAHIWEELLGVDAIGIRDSFFDLGGHSLIAVRLFAKIKAAFHVDYPISVLFEAPTIAGCADLIRDEIGSMPDGEEAAESDEKQETKSTHRYKHLVAMHSGNPGERTPFFLVAGMFGNVLNLRHLAHLLGTERPFYGLQARGLYGEDAPHETFEEMARDYIEEIRTLQPEGPYMLGGFSGGGITAYEIAQQLIKDGQEVQCLVMLDTPVPHRPYLTKADRRKIHAIHLKEDGLAHIGKWAVDRAMWEIGKVRKRLGFDFEEKDANSYHSQEIEAAFRRALTRYKLENYSGAVHLFRPKLDLRYKVGDDLWVTSEMEYAYADNLWTPYVEELHIHEVPGDHDSMVLEPNVRVMAARLREIIQRAEATGAI
jgi:acyl transferase domain-containing protein/thioesterase domain-containing protein/acyl carrier protein